MLDLTGAKFHAGFRITGRRRLAIYGTVLAAASIMLWSLVHQQHRDHALHKNEPSGVKPAPIAISTLH